MLDSLLKDLSAQPGFYETVLLVILLGISSPSPDLLPLQRGGIPLEVRSCYNLETFRPAQNTQSSSS